MSIDVTIQYNTITTSVNKQLSLLGKKTKAGDGSSVFSLVTLSSTEAQNLIGYVKSGMEKVLTALRPFVSACQINDTNTQLTFQKSERWSLGENMPNGTAITEGIKGYLISFVISEILLPNFPQLAQKFTLDATYHMDSLTKIFYFKKPPSSSQVNYSAIVGEVKNK